MPFKKRLGGVVEDAELNKNVGNFSYWVHRITGIGLSLYLIMHFFVLSSAISGPEQFTKRMQSVQSPFFAVLEILLLAGVFYHMLNGLRITLVDFFGWTRHHRVFLILAVIFFVIMMIITIILQLPKFNISNYGAGG